MKLEDLQLLNLNLFQQGKMPVEEVWIFPSQGRELLIEARQILITMHPSLLTFTRNSDTHQIEPIHRMEKVEDLEGCIFYGIKIHILKDVVDPEAPKFWRPI